MKQSQLSGYLNDIGRVDCVSKNINGEISRQAFFPTPKTPVPYFFTYFPPPGHLFELEFENLTSFDLF